MKKLALIGLVVSVIAALAGIYDYLVVQPDKELAEYMLWEEDLTDEERIPLWEASEFGINFAIAVMFAGILGFLLSLIAAIKKEKIAWLGVLLALVGFIIGAGYGTHMFS